MVPPKIHIGHGGKVGIPCEQDAVDVEPGIPHPKVKGVRTGGGNVEGHQVGRAGRGVGPSPGIELLQIDPRIGHTASVQADIDTRQRCIAGKSPDPDVIGAWIGKSYGVVDLRAGRFPVTIR